MDRRSFLASMPFLVPCSSPTWPPRRPAQSATLHSATANNSSNNKGNNHAGTRTDIVLQHQDDYRFKVALEPAIQSTLLGQHNHDNNNHVNASSAQQQSPRMLCHDVCPPVLPIFFARPKKGDSSWQHHHARSPFASTNASSFDPAMTDFEIAIEYACDINNKNTVTNSQDTELKGRVLFRGDAGSASVSKSASSSWSSSRRHHRPNNHSNTTSETPIGTYFKFGGEGVFQVDGRQLLHVQVEQAKPVVAPCSADRTGANSTNDKEVHKAQQDSNDDSSPATGAAKVLPPCLLLVFPCAVLRVFPLGGRATTVDKALETLHSLCRFLTGLPYQQAASRCLGAWSPSSSSLPTSSGEAGQPTAAAGSNSTNNTTCTTAAREEGRLLRKIKRRRVALLQSQAGLEQLEHILDLPVSVYVHHLSPGHEHGSTTTKDADEDDSPKVDADPNTQQHQPRHKQKQDNKPLVDMGPLMTRIVDDMAESYGTRAENIEAVQTLDSRLERHYKSMDSILSSFFPTPRQKLRDNKMSRKHRRSVGVADIGAGGDISSNHEQLSPEQSIQAMKELLQQQKQTVEERYEYLVLPTRG